MSREDNQLPDRGGRDQIEPPGPAPANRYAQPGDLHEERWLAEHLEEGEVALVWLGVSAVKPPLGLPLPAGKVRWRFLVTTSRVELVALPRAWDGTEPVEPRALFALPEGRSLELESGVGRSKVTLGGWCWRTWLTNDDRHREAARLPAMTGVERRREAARLNWIHRDRTNRHGAFALELLQGEAGRSDLIGLLSRAYVSRCMAHRQTPDEALVGDEAAETLRPPLEALIHYDGVGHRLVTWSMSWSVPPIHGLALVEHLLALGEDQDEERAIQAALPLHRKAHTELTREAKEITQRAVLDISLAAHLLRAGERAEAREMLERRKSNLPDEAVADLLPPAEADLTTEGPQVVRIRLLELLVEARGEPDVPDLAALTELARLQPLVRERVEELARAASGPLRERAEVLAGLLAPGGMDLEAAPTEPERDISTLPSALIEEKLPHPATRKVGTVEKLQGRVAKVTIPDHGALRSYAERVTERNNPRVAGLLADAALALGVSGVEVYISHGRKDLGIRAYASSPPFVVIGGQHLDEESESSLSDSELLFALGTEVAHLRFKHTRLTSSDVWDGVFSTSKQALELVGAFSGPLGFLGKAVSGLQRLVVIQKILGGATQVTRGAGKAVQLVGFARRFQSLGKKLGYSPKVAKDTEIGTRESGLLATCRLMQLTADRAGLVLSGNPRAAIEAIFRTSGEYRAELPLVRRHGLTKTLSRRGEDDELMNQALAIRLAALLSFYLSPDYQALREALVGD